MKHFWYTARLLALLFFISTAALTVMEFISPPPLLKRLNYQTPEFQHDEQYDPSLIRLNNLATFTAYCDSIYSEKKKTDPNFDFETKYPLVVADVVRSRFYHGMSSYGFGDNYVCYAINAVLPGMLLNAPVMPDDILKYPAGICSQQATVAMKVLETKKIQTRKVGFHSKIKSHFCFEALYGGGWHFFDTDMEPDPNVLVAYNRPDIEYLVDNPAIIQKAYNKVEPQQVMTVFSTYFYGQPNEKLATNASLFQKITQTLSYTLWIFFLLAYMFARRKYLNVTTKQYVRNRWFSFPNLRPGRPAKDYDVHGSPGA
jgi:hypothetical protein